MSASRKLYVLVVDDDRDFLKLMSRMLESRGHVVAAVTTAVGIVDRVAGVDGLRPDIVVLDCGLPGERQGSEVLQALAQDPRTRDVPVVLTSASPGTLTDVPESAHPRWHSHVKDGRVASVIAAIEAAAALGVDRTQEAKPPAPKPAGKRRPLLLIAEDDLDIREQAALWLADAGFDIRTANHGGDAIAQLEAGLRPDAIVLDLNMPVVSGWGVYEWLQQSACAEVPVIVWTAGATPGAVTDARVVPKGQDPQVLLDTIRASTLWSRGLKGGGS